MNMDAAAIDYVYNNMTKEDLLDEEVYTAYLIELRDTLATLDEVKIRAFYRKHFPNGRVLPMEAEGSGEMFWRAVHKMVTGFRDIDINIRRKSKAWLDERGYQAYDDGDL